MEWVTFYDDAGLRPVINVSGTMTSLGASIAVPEVAQAMAAILPRFVLMDELHAKASKVIARATGAEAGFVTASASAGITLAIAATMTGPDLARVEQLPATGNLPDGVVIQAGHLCHYGAPIEQAIRLSGARPLVAGTATLVSEHALRGALDSPGTTAALYVVSHHVVDYGQVPLRRFCEMCRERGIPVIVDAASEYDLTGFLAEGADIVIYSSHKFLGGPTGGIVAGREDLVRATYMQNAGIGRGMKAGKETIFGVIAALETWSRRNHAAIRDRERQALELWCSAVGDQPGITARVIPDPTGNPLERLRLDVDPAVAGASAMAIAKALAGGEPSIIVRNHEVENGIIQLDPCNLHDGQEGLVARRLHNVLTQAADGELIEPERVRQIKDGGAAKARS